MSDLLPITREDMVDEIERELEQREIVYPKLIAAGRLRRSRAERRVEIMRAVLELVRDEA